MMKTTKKIVTDQELTTQALEAERVRIEAEHRAQLADLEAKLLQVRGTRRDMKPIASLATQLEELLKYEPTDIAGAAERIGAPASKIQVIIRTLRDAGRLRNIGTEDGPRWQLALGDDGPTQELSAVVARLIRERPWTHAELVDLTGARANRISGVIAKLVEDASNRVVNVGTHARARWFALPPGVRISRG